MQLKDNVALVLGAGGCDNIGQAIAHRYATEGAQVVVSGRNMAELHVLSEEIGGFAIGCDITSLADIERLVAHTVQRLGRHTVAGNCVGLNLGKPFLETTDDELRRLYEVRFKGPFQFLQVVIPAMRDGGSIIRISSAASSILLDDYAAYGGRRRQSIRSRVASRMNSVDGAFQSIPSLPDWCIRQ